MRYDPSMMTPEQIAAANAKHMQSIYGGLGMQKPDVDPYAGTGLEGTGGVKGQQVSYISDLGYEPEFVPPQDSTGTLGINPDTGDTFLPNEPPPRPLDIQTGNDFDTRPQVYGNPYGIQGGPQMGAGKAVTGPQCMAEALGATIWEPLWGGFGRPPMGGGKGGGRPPMYGNPYGGGFGGGFGRPPMGGGFGGRMAAPGYNLGTGTFGGGFNPYIGGPRSQIPPSGTYMTDASGLPPGARTLTGGMMATTNPDGTTTVGAGQLPQSDQLLGSGIAGVNLAGANQPTNPYSTGYGMGYQQQPNQQPNQQPMGGGKGGAQSGGGKGGRPMIKWDPEKGWYDTNTGVGLNSPEEEARKKKYFEDKNKFLEENMYDPSRDYSDDFGGLFGADVDESAELYYGGPQQRWQGALSDRLQERMGRKENVYNYSGYYEGSTGTMDKDLQRQMYRRNNAIEDMFRKGYSSDQILAHTEGKRNVIEEGPDYKDYEKAKAGQKVYGMKGRKDWADDYFDVPEYETQTGTEGDGGADAGQTNTGQTGSGSGDQSTASQPPPAGLPGKGGASGSGKGGAQTPQQTQPPQQSSPFQPQQSQRRSMYSSSPAGLGTGYYGGMGSGGRQFGGGSSYFGGFGGQPSYYGGYSQPYQQSYQQPSYGGYSSYGGYGGSIGGIGSFYQPMGYGGYR